MSEDTQETAQSQSMSPKDEGLRNIHNDKQNAAWNHRRTKKANRYSKVIFLNVLKLCLWTNISYLSMPVYQNTQLY